MSLSDWQGSFNGLTFGAGQDVGITGITGLRGLPDMRIAEPVKPRADGSYPAVQLMGGRTVKLSLDLAAPSTDQYYEDLADVAAAFGPIEDPANGGAPIPFEFQDPSWDEARFVNCRPSKGEINMDLAYAQGLAIFDVELLCDDPLIYSSNIQSVACGSGSAVEVTNYGNYPSLPWFEIIGPLEWFEVRVGGNVMITCTDNVTGDAICYLDCRTHTAYRANGQNLYPLLSALPSWFSLPPGETEVEVTFGSGGSTTAATINFASAFAWV